jgi:enoyl-[acyl-carrier protein] reductase I
MSLAGRRILVTGIADSASLALPIARELAAQGASLVCAGLGPVPGQEGLSEAAREYLERAHETFVATVAKELGEAVPTFALDAAVDESIAALAGALAARGLAIDGLVHAIALDKTIRGGAARPLLAVTRQEFLDCMSVSAWSLVAFAAALDRAGVLAAGGSLVALSYLGAERVMAHPYRNIGVAKAALERIVRELAAELGPVRGVRVNAVRFSPYTASRAGGAIPGLEAAVEEAGARAPLGNATPGALAQEVAHLLRPGLGVTGEVRHVDGGYHVLA